jgi:hypothetical protein
MAADTPSTPPPPAPATRTNWSAGRILLVVLGSIVALLGAGLLAAGGALLWADQTQRDDEGFLTTPTERFERDSYAIVSDNIDLFEAETGSDWILSDDVLGDVRLRSENVEGGDTFVGIAPTAELNSYLGTVEHDEVTDLDFDPFSVSYRRISGGEPTGPPTEQTFWAASAAGPGEQTATWEPESGDWTIVVMNADGSRGVAVELSAGADANFLLWLAIGLMIAGVLVLGGGVAMIVFGARGAASGAAATAAVVPGAEEARPSVYPVALRGELDAGLSRWLWVVKWLLAIPHYILLVFLWIAFWILSVIAFFAILFTGRYPRGIFDFNVGVLRWTWRVGFYTYWALGTDRYPPFTLGPAPDYPATLEIEYPERLSHWLPLVKWILAIPHLILVGIFVGGWGWGWGWGDNDLWGVGIAGLVGVLVVIAGFVLLFTGRYPRTLFDFALGLDRWVFRVAAYVSLMRDEYPPFQLDMGPIEPAKLAEPAEATSPPPQPPEPPPSTGSPGSPER